MMFLLRLFAGAITALLLTVTLASAQVWVSKSVTQPAKYTIDNKKWIEIKPGMQLPKSSWVHVGRRGKLVVIRGKENISFKSNTLTEFIQTRGDVKTEIRQKSGFITVDVQKRNRQHMTVHTPYLAAVVKGTKFSVKVAKGKAHLRVNRGLVQVTDPIRGQQGDVAGGQRVSIGKNSKGTMKVRGRGKKAPVRTVKKSKPIDPDTSDLSDSSGSGNGNGNGNSGNNGNGNGNNGNGNGNSGNNGNGNGNSGNNGNGNGNSGNNGNGNGNSGNNGNGNGNSGNNGNGNGNNK